MNKYLNNLDFFLTFLEVEMSTRGLIIVKGNIEEKNEDKMPIAVYNHSSSYPSWLGAKIRDMLQELWVPRYSPDGRDYELAK